MVEKLTTADHTTVIAADRAAASCLCARPDWRKPDYVVQEVRGGRCGQGGRSRQRRDVFREVDVQEVRSRMVLQHPRERMRARC